MLSLEVDDDDAETRETLVLELKVPATPANLDETFTALNDFGNDSTKTAALASKIEETVSEFPKAKIKMVAVFKSFQDIVARSKIAMSDTDNPDNSDATYERSTTKVPIISLPKGKWLYLLEMRLGGGWNGGATTVLCEGGVGVEVPR